eukprot:225562_1
MAASTSQCLDKNASSLNRIKILNKGLKQQFIVFGYIRNLQTLIDDNNNNYDLFKNIETTIIHICLDYYYLKSANLYCFGYAMHGRLGLMGIQHKPTIFPQFYNYNCKRKPTICPQFSEMNCIAISSFHMHSLCIDMHGAVYAFGYNGYGALGLNHKKSVYIPTLVTALVKYKAIQVSVGTYHSLILTHDKNVWSMGLNNLGQLGHNNTEQISIPRMIDTLKSYNIKQVCCGGSHSGAITNENKAFLWGCNANGACGMGQNNTNNINYTTSILNINIPKISVPMMLNMGDNKANKMAMGEYHTLILSTKGTLLSFGNGYFGRLGHGSTNTEYVPKVIKSLKSIPIIDIECGSSHNLCISNNGNVYSFGMNGCGQLGIGNSITQTQPHRIDYFAQNGIKIIAINGGRSHSIFISEKGQLFMCGDGRQTQLGPTTIKEINPIPFELNAFKYKDIHSVSLGYDCSFVILK